MAWVSIHEQLRDHPKTRRLASLLGTNRHEAIGILVCLWLWGIDNADRDGIIIDADENDIADGVMSRGQSAGHLVDCLVKSGWIDRKEEGGQLCLHDWDVWRDDWFQYLDKKAKDAERKRSVRKTKADPDCPVDSPPDSPPDSSVDVHASYYSIPQHSIIKHNIAENNKGKETEDNVVCTEPSAEAETPHSKKSAEASPVLEVVITLPLNDKSEYPITQEQCHEWADLYPAVDVIQQLRSMRGWLDANPTKRKTKSGILRFVNGWLSKEQNNGGNKRGPPRQEDSGNIFLDMAKERGVIP